MPDLLLPAARLPRWVENFAHRHGETLFTVVDGALGGRAADGSTCLFRLPFAQEWTGDADPEAFARSALPPEDWGVLLVRKGGFAIARLQGAQLVDSKTGQRHVQGRTKAGGQSQQRFARRRDNQAKAAFGAAADHAARILTERSGLQALVIGGDHAAVEAALDDARLRTVRELVTGPWLATPDPRRSVLEQAVADAQSVAVDVVNA
ncbi:acVLRF1 family peptidyl-tRNA hydrolase [Nocardioides sp. Bht2]|uniref:acVLRF1 family peptidyl-tRNA hydrolase n=1 Tax=Nocardioides sp. Bht2 TaxID=3392297 RepID=UPI0039B5E009